VGDQEKHKSNQRVTNAMLGLQLNHLAERVDEMHEDVKEWRDKMEVRVRKVEDWQTYNQSAMNGVKRQGRIETVGAGVVAAIVGIIAAVTNK